MGDDALATRQKQLTTKRRGNQMFESLYKFAIGGAVASSLALAATGAQKRLYKPRDTHWNIAGNQLAANVIGVHLEKFAKWNK
jgi:fructose-1,6-bisphosphatase/inositol monophosphatase family enzyme